MSYVDEVHYAPVGKNEDAKFEVEVTADSSLTSLFDNFAQQASHTLTYNNTTGPTVIHYQSSCIRLSTTGNKDILLGLNSRVAIFVVHTGI